MLRNYFKIACRNLLRSKAFSLINIVGLAMGLTCCLLLVVYLQHELSYDKFHGKADRIARVIMKYQEGGHEKKGNFTSTKVFPEFKRRFPEISNGVRMSGTYGNSRLVKYNNQVFQEQQFIFADSTFFNVFDFKLLHGIANEVLKAPKMVVLTQSAAKKYFGNENPVGKWILVGSKQTPYMVTGVSEDCPTNSQIKYDMIASLSTFGPLQEDTYTNANYTTYLLLNGNTALEPLQRKITAYMDDLSKDSDFKINFELEPFLQIHLHSPYDAFTPNSNISYVYIISGIAVLILIIACCTYINLSTASSTERAKEVGIRKVSGAFRSQMFAQFISESAVLTTTALLLGFGIVLLLLPAFNTLTGVTLHHSAIFSPLVLTMAGIAALIVALLAGSYPAFVLARFEPVKVLKGAFKNTSKGTALRKGLIVFQFTISIFLIISTFVIKNQLQLIQNKKLGYDRENVLVLDIDQVLLEKIDLVKTELKNIPAVKAVSLSYESPVKINGGYSMSGTDLSKAMSVNANPVDENYTHVMGLELIAGSHITQQDVKDATQTDDTKNYYHFILNESAANALGWSPQQAIGKKMYLDESRPGEVKAVVKDFHFESLHSPIQPLVLFPGGWANNLFVKTNGANMAELIAAIGKKWKTLAPHRPFTFHFLEEDYQKMYDAEMRTGKAFNVFALLAIVLACLGLFGLSAFAARQRIKEIGVRKVLGASVASISMLLSSGFLKLVALSFLVACPLAWFSMHKWLQQFSYKVQIAWWHFALAALLCMLIAGITVSIQAIKAAIANPVKSLRTE
jgi:putative ABC transport system permease protein